MKEQVLGNGEIIFGEKLEGIKYTSRASVYGIAFNEEGKVAAVKTPKGYFLPGGGIEQGESYEECVKREFLEETGYEISVGDYLNKLSLYHKTRDNIHMYFQGYFYIVTLEQLTDSKIEKDHELIWLEPEAAVEEMHSKHQSRAVAEAVKLCEGLRNTIN